jgi:hypothetical protein
MFSFANATIFEEENSLLITLNIKNPLSRRTYTLCCAIGRKDDPAAVAQKDFDSRLRSYRQSIEHSTGGRSFGAKQASIVKISHHIGQHGGNWAYRFQDAWSERFRPMPRRLPPRNPPRGVSMSAAAMRGSPMRDPGIANI